MKISLREVSLAKSQGHQGRQRQQVLVPEVPVIAVVPATFKSNVEIERSCLSFALAAVIAV